MHTNIKRNLSTTAIMLFCSVLAGCVQQKPDTEVVSTQKYVAPPTEKELAAQPSSDPETRRLQQCQQELDALKTIAPTVYTQKKLEFDSVMSGAAQYAGIRQGVNGETQGTVDALYHYKAARLCADISQDVLTALSDRGERTK